MTTFNRHLQEEPDAAMVDRHFRRLMEIWSDTHRQWDRYDQYYQRTFQVWDDREAAERPGWLKPARPTTIVDSAVDHQIASEPIFHRFPVSGSREAQEHADQVENALKAIAEDATLLEPVPTYRQIGKNFIHLGYSVHELGMDGYLMQRRTEGENADGALTRENGETDDEFQARERQHAHFKRTMQPFRLRAPHPARVLLDPWEKQPRMAVRHYRRFAQDLEDISIGRQAQGRPTGHFRVDKDPFEIYLVTEWWTEYWHAVTISGRVASSGRDMLFGSANSRRQLLYVDPNTWRFVPWSHGYAGFGQEPTMHERVDPKYFAVGILDSVIADIKAQAQAIAGRHNALMDATFGKIGTRLGADEVRDAIDQGDIIGDIQEGDIWRIQGPQLQRWMFEVESWYSSDIEQGTFSRILSGIRERGMNTVGQTAILSQAAGKKFVSVARQMEHLAATAASQILQLMDLRDLDITVRGHRLRPSIIDRDYSVTASFDLVDPVLDLQKRQIAMNEYQAGLLSQESYWAESGRDDASGEMKRLLKDFVFRHPLLHEELAMEVAREMGVEELIERAIERNRLAAQTNGNGQRANGSQLGGILGPDGQPLQQTLGSNANPEALLTQGLTDQVPNPPRTGQNFAAGGL
jgi:hypothetical protein